MNTSKAFAAIDDFVNLSNDFLDKFPKDRSKKGEILANLGFIKNIFGILEDKNYFKFGVSNEQKEEIENLINQRYEAKKERNFIKADEIRDKLLKNGISIMDTPNGTSWEKI